MANIESLTDNIRIPDLNHNVLLELLRIIIFRSKKKTNSETVKMPNYQK